MPTVTSARSNYRDVIAIADAADAGRLKALANVQVSVFLPGTANPATIYGSRNPADLTPLANPLTTDATGIINFWAEVGEYDIFFHDTIAPARIADQTIGWSALSPVTKGLPSSIIRDDAAIGFASLDSGAMRQVVPLGTKLDWWRPFSTYDAGAGAGNAPPGYEICDGRTLAADQHDFGGGSPITLPDLRNKFVIGADILKTDGTASTNGDGTAAYNAQHPNAPGIRGAGGSNTIKDLRHTHQFAHTHGTNGVTTGTAAADRSLGHSHSPGSFSAPDHLHGPNNIYVNGHSRSSPNLAGGGYEAAAFSNSISSAAGGTTAGADRGLGIGGGSGGEGAPDHLHYNTVPATTTASQSTSTTDNGTLTNSGGVSAPLDVRPQHYGMLAIMKVRRA